MTELAAINEFVLSDEKAKKAQDFIDRLFPRKDIKRILWVTPPDADADLFNISTAKRGRYTNYPPYGIAAMAAHLEKMDVESKLCNLNHYILKKAKDWPENTPLPFNKLWQERLAKDIEEFRPDMIGITCMFTMTHLSFKRVCEFASQYGIPIASGGVHLTNDVERTLDDIPFIQFAFLNEGDLAIQKFIQVVRGEISISQLGQLVMNDAQVENNQGRLHFPKQVQPSGDDISIIPRFDLAEIGEHADYGTIGAFYCFKPKGTKFATVLSNRGCRAQCTFCSVRNFNGPGVRQRSVDSVIDELLVLQNDYGVGHFMWLDDDLLRDHSRAITLFNKMVQKNINMTWDATNGVIASSCLDEVISAAASSGCIAINIGMESGNRQILRQVKKPGTVETFLKAAEVFKKYEQIHASVLLIVGLPGETMRMILDTINVSRQMDLDWYRISVLQPLPNTPIYDSMVAQGIIQDVGSKELRFMGGSYGKQAEIEGGKRLSSMNFEEAFSAIPLDKVPTPDQITDIWFYMNYHLSFHRLFSETRPVKIKQQLQHLKVLSDVISPENGFALYFSAYLQHKLYGDIGPNILERLRGRMSSSTYWQDRFHAFGLSFEDIEKRDFKNKHIPVLLPGKIPLEETIF